MSTKNAIRLEYLLSDCVNQNQEQYNNLDLKSYLKTINFSGCSTHKKKKKQFQMNAVLCISI